MYCKVTETKKSQPDPDQQKTIRVSKEPVQQKGLRVIARNDDDGFYYPGMSHENTSDMLPVYSISIFILWLAYSMASAEITEAIS